MDRQNSRRDEKKAAVRKDWLAAERKRLELGRKPRRQPGFPRPRLTADEKRRIDRNLPATTLMDYLWRLRRRSNYEDATMFTEGPEDSDESRDVHANLRLLTSSTLLVNELLVRRLVGADAFDRIVERWLQNSTASGASGGLAQRLVLFS